MRHFSFSVPQVTESETRFLSFKFLRMVCSRCEKKMGKLVVPDKWKDGARNANPGGISISISLTLQKKVGHTQDLSGQLIVQRRVQGIFSFY